MSLLQKELEFWLASLPATGAIKIQELLKYFKTEEQILRQERTSYGRFHVLLRKMWRVLYPIEI